MNLISLILPETILFIAAAVLFIMGGSRKPAARHASPVVAMLGLIVAALALIFNGQTLGHDRTYAIDLTQFSNFVKAISIGVAALFVLLAWPTTPEGDANRSISYSTETSEYFALLLLAVAGMCVVAGANTLPTLFLGIELASIPTYIMVTMSRPHEQAQEAGVKYFFLGAAAAAILVFGMSYLFGVTGQMQLDQIINVIRNTEAPVAPGVLLLASVLIVIGILFKMAAAPLHFYAGDVYQGAATPVTAAISFIPKLTATVALLKILYAIGGGQYAFDPKLVKLMWVLAVLTMTVGNVLALLQHNVKRVLAYSSVAHSGYLLVGVTTVMMIGNGDLRNEALAAIAFYLLTYGIMNTAAFGVLMLLPGRKDLPAMTAETYDDIAGTARQRPLLGIAMTVSCLSLIGVPATAGFLGKLYILKPAVQSGQPWLVWLAVITMINAAISAAYYLKIVGGMWGRADATSGPADCIEAPCERSTPIATAIALSVVGVLAIGIVFPLASSLFRGAFNASAASLGL